MNRMYPDLDTLRTNDNSNRGNSFFEQNCSQIFTKGPAFTKEILGKVHAEIVPKKTYMFGREFKTKRVLLTTGLCLLFSASFFAALLTWFTNTFDNFVLSQLVLTNNSAAFKMWQKPSAKAVYYVYMFNYTNVHEYQEGLADKLNINEAGPYAYEETLERIDISFPTEDTISYRERRSLKFMTKLSKGHENDMLVVPNVLVFGGSAATKSRSYFTQLGFNGILSAFGEEAFQEISAGSFITGYNDQLYELATNFLPEGTPKKMGLLVTKIGETTSKTTINTGKIDINKYGIIQNIDNQNEFDYFYGKACNSIGGSDGALQPPKLVQKRQNLYYVFPQVCRRLPLIFDKETTIFDGRVPAYQYVHPDDLFDTAQEKPENACFCDMEFGKCPPKGVLNVSKCNFDAPMFISHPHFHRADPKLLKHFTGLKPNGRNYKSHFKIHPTMGFTMDVRNVFQVNIQVQKARSVAKVSMLEDEMILPIAWLEGILDEKTLSQDIVDTINLVTFTVPSIKLALKYGSLLTSIITLACLVIVYKTKSKNVHLQRLIRTEHGYYVPN